MALLCLGLTLLLAQLWISQHGRKHDERHAEADTRDAQQPLHALVARDDGGPLGGANGVLVHDAQRAAVEGGRQGGVARKGEVALEGRQERLRPDGAGDAVAERGADGVAGEVEAGDDSDVLVLRGGLDGGLGWVGEETAGETEEDLCADDAGFGGGAGTASVVDQEAKGDHEEERAGEDEVLEAADLEDDKRGEDSGDDGEEGVEGGHAQRHCDVKVKGDDQDRVQEITLEIPCKVEEAGYTQSTPDCTILEEVKGHEGVGSAHLPKDKDGDAQNANDQGRNDMGAVPG